MIQLGAHVDRIYTHTRDGDGASCIPRTLPRLSRSETVDLARIAENLQGSLMAFTRFASCLMRSPIKRSRMVI